MQVLNPATGGTLIEMASCSTKETENAIQQAHKAFPHWSAVSAFERGEFLTRWKDAIMKNQDDIARIMTLECGKPLQESKNEIVAGVGSLSWFAGEATRCASMILALRRRVHVLF